MDDVRTHSIPIKSEKIKAQRVSLQKGDALTSTPAPLFFDMMKDAYYFPHDANAHRDEKILALRIKHGLEGYGIFWVLIETLFESTNHKYSMKHIDRLAYSHNIAITLLEDVINTCIAEKLLIQENDYFFSESLLRRVQVWEDKKAKKRIAGKLGAKVRWHRYSTDVAKNGKVKEIKVNESKVNNISIPPEIKDVEEFFKQQKSSILEAEKFSDFYASKGWVVGKVKMKDWKAAARNWIKRNGGEEKHQPKDQWL